MKIEMESYDLCRLKELGKTYIEACASDPLPVGSLNIVISSEEISFEDIDINSGSDLDINDAAVGVSDLWTSGGTTELNRYI